MDPLDPLSTSDPCAPHTSSISSNRFLLKKAEDKPILGNILKVIRAEELETEFQGVWVATAMPEGEVEGRKTALVHMKGVKLVWKGGKAGLMEAVEGRVMVRLVGGEARGREIGELQGRKVYAELETEAGEEKADVDLLLRAMKGVFPYDERMLAYYLYTHFKEFPTLTTVNSEVAPPSDLAESISQLNLGKFRTGVPHSEAPLPPPPQAPSLETIEVPLPEVPKETPEVPQVEVSDLPKTEASDLLKTEPLEVPAVQTGPETSV